MDKPIKTRPPYAITSVDHALKLAAILQVEGRLTVSEAAARLDVARSTAHRLLAMLVYRDFAVQDEDKVYRAGPVLELAAHSRSTASRLRQVALPHLQRLVDLLGESANVAVRTGDTCRFIASVESPQSLKVGSREGMVFPAHRTTAGLLLLAQISDEELASIYSRERYADQPADRPDLDALRTELERVRRSGFAFNDGRTERGVVAVGVPVRGAGGDVVAGMSISMPSVRYDKESLPSLVSTLMSGAAALERDLSQG